MPLMNQKRSVTLENISMTSRSVAPLSAKRSKARVNALRHEHGIMNNVGFFNGNSMLEQNRRTSNFYDFSEPFAPKKTEIGSTSGKSMSSDWVNSDGARCHVFTPRSTNAFHHSHVVTEPLSMAQKLMRASK